MLYVTTRNKDDVYTAFHALSSDRCSNGGLYVPLQLPVFSAEEITAFKHKSFGQCIADILNLFFSCRLDGWDVDFCIGKYPTKLVPMSHKILVAEAWHNPDWNFNRIVRNLAGRVCGAENSQQTSSNWAQIAIHIAVLFAIFGQLEAKGIATSDQKIDIAVTAGDFSVPMAVWYARQMGLPIGTVICGCNDNGALWDIIHHGQIHMDTVAVPTSTPLADVGVPSDLERLIFATLGYEETQRYCSAADTGSIYAPDEEQFERMRTGIFSAVVSQKRMESVIRNVYRTSTYLLSPYAALAYGALQDYRAGADETRPALILTECSPICCAETVAGAMGLTVEELKSRMNVT